MQPDRRDAALLLDMIQFAEEVRVIVERTGYRDVDPERIRNVVDVRLRELVERLQPLVPAIPPDPEPE